MDVVILIKNCETGEIEEIRDLYWFEENSFHNNDSYGYVPYVIIGMKFEKVV